ncbi:uncharacterized protein LOC144464418 [Epinephelus lanceolatus]
MFCPSAVAEPRILPSSWPATDPQSPHPITTATVTPPLRLRHSSSSQPIGSLDASLIYIQVKDSTDGVKDPVAMVTRLGQDSGSLVMQLAGEQTTRGKPRSSTTATGSPWKPLRDTRRG